MATPWVTLSVIRADTGGWVGHTAVHHGQVSEAERRVEDAWESGLIIDGQVA